MEFDFTVAVIPKTTDFNRELRYAKSAILYADTVNIVSPTVEFYSKITQTMPKADEETALKIAQMVIPLYKEGQAETYIKFKNGLDQMNAFIKDKNYRSRPLAQRLEMKHRLQEFMKELMKIMQDFFGEAQCKDLEKLMSLKGINLHKFNYSIGDTEKIIKEYLDTLEQATQNSYTLFDEDSKEYIKLAMKEKLISLSEFDQERAKHAGVSDKLISTLPTFDFASIDEILDIKKELQPSIIRFRSKMLQYSEQIKDAPWDKNFEGECTQLYIKEVAPALLEIEELTKEAGFLRNLGRSLIADETFFRCAGSLTINIAAAGVVSAFSDAVRTDIAMGAAGGMWATSKALSAYQNKKIIEQEINKKEMVFYYKAGKMLSK